MMANGWLRALNCSNKATQDVHNHNHHSPLLSKPKPKPKPNPKPKPKPPTTKPNPNTPNQLLPKTLNPPLHPNLTSLPPSTSSHQVLHLIFHQTWSPPPPPPTLKITSLFKLNHSTSTIARFEAYRLMISGRAGPEDSRCAADGNEMMRFSPVPGRASAEGVRLEVGYCGGLRTFAGTGFAHERGGGGEGRRKGMWVCRVIAGRVRTGLGGEDEGKYESVEVRKGELVVFDSRAVLPCFLIIYTI